jgi:hypothetical protein
VKEHFTLLLHILVHLLHLHLKTKMLRLWILKTIYLSFCSIWHHVRIFVRLLAFAPSSIAVNHSLTQPKCTSDQKEKKEELGRK